MDEGFYLWYKFNFSSIQEITHNENRYTAVRSDNNYILVWKQDEDCDGPATNSAKLVSLIDFKEKLIIHIQWIYHSDYLMIQTKEHVIIYDVFKNATYLEYEFTGRVHFCQYTSLGFQIITDNGSFIILTKTRTQLISNNSELFFPAAEAVIVYPDVYKLDGESMEKFSLDEYKTGWRERRKVETSSDIEIDGDLYTYPLDWQIPDLTLPKSKMHIFKDSETLFIHNLGDLLLVQSNRHCLVAKRTNDDWEAIQISSFPVFGFKVNTKSNDYYILRSSDTEYQVRLDHKLVLEEISTEMQGTIEFHNMPPFFYFDLNQDLAFARFNWRSGFVWFPDFHKDHLFLDLITSRGSIFQNTGRDRYAFIQIAETAEYVLDWRRGEKYPSGTLYYRDIKNPESDPIVIYDVKETTSILTESEFEETLENSEEISFPLIIPQWHKVELPVYYKTYAYKQEISNSQYYLLLEYISKSESAAALTYPVPPEDGDSFILYGDLRIKIKNRYIAFEGISPIWSVLEDNYLAFHHIDGRLYVLDITETFTRPLLDFPSSFPFYMDFIADHYLVVLSLELRNTTLHSHPSEDDDLDVEFPYITMKITNLLTKKHYLRGIRFPLKLKNRQIRTEFDSAKQEFSLRIPSYTDPFANMQCVFDLNKHVFRVENFSDSKRYWEGFTQNSPKTFYKHGEEFHVIEHPEIKREYTLRPFYIFENMLVRKSDNLVISVVDHMVKHQQLSTHDLYTLEGTKILELPFYFTQSMKPIYIDQEYAQLLSTSVVNLESKETLPREYKIKPNLFSNDFNYLRRISEMLDRLYEAREIHTDNGIVYDSLYWDDYKDEIENMIGTTKRKLR